MVWGCVLDGLNSGIGGHRVAFQTIEVPILAFLADYGAVELDCDSGRLNELGAGAGYGLLDSARLPDLDSVHACKSLSAYIAVSNNSCTVRMS